MTVVEGSHFIIGRELAAPRRFHALPHRSPFVIAEPINALLMPDDDVFDGLCNLIQKVLWQGCYALHETLALCHDEISIAIVLGVIQSLNNLATPEKT
jgi:hypothetical protein